MAIIHANTVLSGSPAHSLRAPPCIFPPLTNQSLFYPFQGTKGRSTARAIPSLLRVPAALGVSILAPAQPDLPGHPGLCAGRAGAHTCPHGRVGTLVLTGSLEATCCIWDREQSQCFTSPPTWADFLLGVFTIFPRWLPMGTSQAEMPVGLAVHAGEGGGVLLIYLLELLLLRSPARKRGMHRPPLCSGALLGGTSQPWYFWL